VIFIVASQFLVFFSLESSTVTFSQRKSEARPRDLSLASHHVEMKAVALTVTRMVMIAMGAVMIVDDG
jgi:hypothetical protein